MPLVFLIVAVLVLGLGLVQVWTIWFLKREVQRLEFRLNESLDDEDLVEFQDRLKALLKQAKETADRLVSSADQRRETLEKSLEKAKQAEKSLALRIVAQTASAASNKVKAEAKPPAKAPPRSAPEPPPAKAALKSGTKAGPATPGSPKTLPFDGRDGEGTASKGRDDKARRSYLVRPQAPEARYQKIYDLADQGLSLEQIAKHSGLLSGEVDLILNLRREGPPSA
ncbi:MAG TPA: hypothetical protein VK786_03600 [bacterium]|jgi:hypothetical protein|nr:hypothetical protein [bacterium]